MSRTGRIAAVAACALVLGCGGPPPGPASDLPSWRDRSLPIASAALFDPGRYLGRWHLIAAYDVPALAGCAAVTADHAAASDGTLVVTTRCLLADGTARDHTARATITGPGRLLIAPDTGPAGGVHWVLWVDEGYRTAVVGQPDGQGGAIWNRDPVMPPDRLAAAREVLDFNGYDLSGLRRIATP